MKISERGLQLIADFEGYRGKPYNDPIGHCTIGFGHLIHYGNCDGSEPAEFKAGISRNRAVELLRQDAKRFEKAINDYVSIPLAQHQFDVLVSWLFNVGVSWAWRSYLVERLNKGEYDAVPEELRRFVYGTDASGNKVKLAGLVNRREKEARIWMTGYDGTGDTMSLADWLVGEGKRLTQFDVAPQQALGRAIVRDSLYPVGQEQWVERAPGEVYALRPASDASGEIRRTYYLRVPPEGQQWGAPEWVNHHDPVVSTTPLAVLRSRPIPFKSQLGQDAALLASDCGPTVAAMVREGLTGIQTAPDFVVQTMYNLGLTPDYSLITELRAALRYLGVRSAFHSNLGPDRSWATVRESLGAGKPVMALMSYPSLPYRPFNYTLDHYILFVRMQQRQDGSWFAVYLDPYRPPNDGYKGEAWGDLDTLWKAWSQGVRFSVPGQMLTF